MNPVELTTPKEQLELLYPDLKRIKTKVKLEFPNCDVHLLRMPKSVDPLLLLNKEISLEEKFKIRLDEKYVIEDTTKPPDPMLIVSDHSKILNPRKNFIMTKYLKVKKQRDIYVRENGNVELPNNLKARHPLFGSVFEDKIHLSEKVQMKLSEAIESVTKRKIKEKKNKLKRKIKQEQEDIQQNEVIYDLLNIHRISPVKMKTENSTDSSFSTCNSSKNPYGINREGQNGLVRHILNGIKQEIETTYETDGESQICKRKKKKKEKVRDQEVDTSMLEDIKQDPDSFALPKSTTANTIANSTLSPNTSRIPSFSPNLSAITTSISPTVKKEKKRKHTNFEEYKIENGINNIPNDIISEPSLFHKVKKRRRDKSLDY